MLVLPKLTLYPILGFTVTCDIAIASWPLYSIIKVLILLVASVPIIPVVGVLIIVLPLIFQVCAFNWLQIIAQKRIERDSLNFFILINFRQ